MIGKEFILNARIRLTNCKKERCRKIVPLALIKQWIWNALADNYGHVMAVDRKQSRTRSLHLPTLNLKDKPELSDDELREQMDMHTIIVSCLNDEPLFTTEQVIEEIEEMMQDSPDLGAEQNHPFQSDLSTLSLDIQRPRTNHSYEERERTLCVAELNERLEEVEMAIRHYSEELIQHLALRDELDFEKEYLTTVIPYEKKGGPPSVEDLQILTQILHAMRDDSDKVPRLLTDYILKVLCPTETGRTITDILETR
eukprot:XP_014024419.1 PREDICTED: fasciculation and elongation protein zeta-2-like isoform X2 [Salmo salar]